MELCGAQWSPDAAPEAKDGTWELTLPCNDAAPRHTASPCRATSLTRCCVPTGGGGRHAGGPVCWRPALARCAASAAGSRPEPCARQAGGGRPAPWPAPALCVEGAEGDGEWRGWHSSCQHEVNFFLRYRFVMFSFAFLVFLLAIHIAKFWSGAFKFAFVFLLLRKLLFSCVGLFSLLCPVKAILRKRNPFKGWGDMESALPCLSGCKTVRKLVGHWFSLFVQRNSAIFWGSVFVFFMNSYLHFLIVLRVVHGSGAFSLVCRGRYAADMGERGGAVPWRYSCVVE